MAARRGRRIAAAAVSAAAHVLVLTAIALHAPTLVAPEEESAAPPEPVIPVLLVPKLPPSQQPTPIRLHRRPQRFAAPPPIAPLVAPKAAEPPPTRPGPAAPAHPAPLPEGPKADLRGTLRGSPVGCANGDSVNLTPEERAHCDEELGKLAKTAPALGLGVRDPEAFDQAAAHKEACRAYREGRGPFPGLRGGGC